MCLLSSPLFRNFRLLNLGMMQTKFSIMLGILAMIAGLSNQLFAQTACFGSDSDASAPVGFQLTVEPFASFDGLESGDLASLAGLTTYRVYLETTSEMDFVSAVYADGANGTVSLTSSTSFYMNTFGGLTVNDINPGLFSFFPALEFDSHVTIGLESEAVGGESSIVVTGVSATEVDWSDSFMAGGDLIIDGSNAMAGDGWSVPSGATNGYSGEDMRILLAQLTTDGELNGSLFVELIPAGATAPESHQFSFSSEVCGCTDDSAANYQPGATLEDGSCIFLGCTDSAACNYNVMANEDDGTCDYCCDSVVSSNPDYGVEVELHAVGGITGLRTYRLYITMANPTDVLSAVSGYSEYPLNISTTTDFYQYLGPGGGATPATWLPDYGLLPDFADGVYDSFVTIGIDQMASAGAGEANASLAITPGEAWDQEFEAGNDISISSSSGGAWFLSPGATNGIAGVDNRVLIGQFTTDGYLSGDLYVQVFPDGDQGLAEEIYMSWTSPLCACTDESACNFDPEAIWDDGSCQDGPAYWGENLDCEGNCLNDADGDYVCDENEIPGCLNPNACNYVAAPTDLITCLFPDDGYDCDGNCLNDADGDGICDEFEDGGCTDPQACNYDPSATDDNGTCSYPEIFVLGDVPTSTIAECSLFADGPNANWQYVLTATTPDDPNSNLAQTLELNVISLPGSGATYRVAKTTANGNWFFGPAEPLTLGMNTKTVGAVSFSRSVKFQFSNGEGEFDSLALNGENLDDCTSSEAEISTCSNFTQGNNANWPYVFTATTADDPNSNQSQTLEINITALNTTAEVFWRVAKTTANGNWFFGPAEPLAIGMNSKTVGAVSFSRSVKFQFSSGAIGFNELNLNGVDVNECGGPLESAVYDCDGICLNDTDGDGTCDELETFGCTDESACNYDESVTEEDGSCDYCCATGASVEGYNVLIETVGESPEGTIQRMYIETSNASDVLSAVTGGILNPTYIRSTLPFYQSELVSGVTANGINPNFFSVFPETAYDSWITIGIESGTYGPTESSVEVVPSLTNWQGEFQSGNDIELDGEFGDGWFVTWDENAGVYSNGLAGDDKKVLVGQFTTNGILSGQLFVQMFPEGDQQNPIQIFLPFGYASDDTDAPIFTYVPEDITQSCSDAHPTEMAVAVDEGCIAEVDLTLEESFEPATCGYTLTRTWTATDAWGNTATAVQVVSLEDNEPPVAVVQEDLTVECTDDLTPGAGIAEYPVNSFDNCASDDLTFEYADVEMGGSADLTGITADFHVEMGKDFGGPFGQSLILEAQGVTVGDGPEIDYSDLSSNPSSHRGAVAIDISGASINAYVDGTDGFPYEYDYAIVTISNMSVSNLADVIVNANGIALGSEVSVSTGSNSMVLTWSGTATYTEDDEADFTVLDNSSCLSTANITRTWTVTDGCNNSDTAVQHFTIVDTQGPEFTSTPANIELSCNDDIPMESVEATDCGSVIIADPVDDIQPGSCGTSYTIFRTWTAADDCGNSTAFTQTIMVTDNEAPVFTFFPEDVTYTAGDAMEIIEPTAEDDCNEVTIEFDDSQDNSNVEVTVITRTWTATDACGNSVSADQIITVNEVLGCMDSVACNFDEGATYDDGSCDYCSCGTGGQDGFGLELELVATHDGSIDGLDADMSTYRVYVTTASPTDFVSSISGDVQVATSLTTTTEFFQSEFGAISPDAINTLFYSVVPSLEYDSWLTIGIDEAPQGQESAITFVEAPDDNWMSEFEAGENLVIDSFFGGSWFTLSNASNGVAGDDQRVLVAQLTTSGQVEGQLYAQIFPNGDSSQDTYLTLGFLSNPCGCTDESACNYDEDAVYNNGCDYPEDAYDCEGNCLNDADGDGVCDELEILGCTTEGNCLYDPNATEHDESMCQVSPFCVGCNDASACNFNPNVNPDPNFNDGSCEYPEEGFDCDGDCLDVNGDLICDVLQGCDHPEACNYDESVEYPYPSVDFCDFCSCANVVSSAEGYGVEVETMASSLDGSTTYQVFVTTPSSTDVVNAILGNAMNPIVLASSSEIYQNVNGSALPSPSELLAFFPDLQYDSFITLGAGTPAEAMSFPPTPDGNDPAWVAAFENGGDIVIDDAVGSGWYMNADVMGQYGMAGDDHRVMVAQLTTPGTIHGQFYVQIFPEGLSAGNTLYLTLSFGSDLCGCTDPMACNYSEENLEDDGSCYYAAEDESCEATCLYDNFSPEVVAMEEVYATTCELAATDIRAPQFSDNCDDNLDISYSDEVEAGDCEGSWTITRTWTAIDNLGNTVSVSQTVNVIDTTGPEFTAPADVTIACTDDAMDLTLTGDVIDAADACSNELEVTYSDAFETSANACFANDIIVRSWSATDACGNTTSKDQVITFIDENAPYFTSVPEGLTLACGSDVPFVDATAADACSAVTVTFIDTEGEMTCTGLNEIVRTFTATDACGNTAFATQVITFADDQAPTGTVEDAEVSCSDYDGAMEYGSVEFSDNCSAAITVMWEETSNNGTGSAGCYEVTRTYTFTDGCGNVSTAVQSISVYDDEAPVFTEAPEDQTSQCAEQPYSLAAADNCSAVEITESRDVISEDECGNYEHLVTLTATDECGNSTDHQFTIVVADTEAPAFLLLGELPADETVECDAVPAPSVLLAADNCDGDVEVVFAESIAEGSCPEAYTITRTWTVNDCTGNSTEHIQTIDVQDTTAPTFEVPSDVTVECDSDINDLTITGDVEDINDACSAEVVVSYSDEVSTGGIEPGVIGSCDVFENGPNETWQFVLVATTPDDPNSNEAQTMSIDVSSLPEGGANFRVAKTTANGNWFFGPSEPLSLGMNTKTVAGVSFARAVKFQFTSGDIEFTELELNGEDVNSCGSGEASCLSDNVVTRTWTVTDGCGNTNSATQTITLEDTTPPVVSFEPNVVISNIATSELDDLEGVEVFDACSDWTYSTSDVWLGNSLTGYELHRTMIFTDACGNSTTIEQNITAVYATGCTYMDAENYDPEAIIDDGSCEYTGCTDMTSANYNPIASIDDGSCVTVGCMDPEGYDYDPNANYPGGCDYPDPCPGDINDDGLVNVGDLLEFFQYYGQVCEE